MSFFRLLNSWFQYRLCNRGDITEQEKETCIRGPAVMIFDLQGNLIDSWGDWDVLPSTPHSCAVDRDARGGPDFRRIATRRISMS
ncbi:MAG TPA: hypothetical protein VFG44_03545 [Burkholderiales bacterium]|jgi:hypothetical protein|nr:hypothetical protein [Burkholderiales bacterium]